MRISNRKNETDQAERLDDQTNFRYWKGAALRRKKGRMNEIPILVRCKPKEAKSSIWMRIVRSWTKSVSGSGVSAGFEMRG